MNYLKQSTATNLKIGPFVDDADGKTAETGLTIARADVLLSKNGGSLTQKNETTTCTHDANGYYLCPIDGTDTNTLGRLQVCVSEAGALPVWAEFLVVTANVYDTLCSTDIFDVNVTAVSNGAITNAAVADDVDVNVKTISANAITSTAIQDGAITNAKVADDVDVNVKTITAGAITAAAIATDAIDSDAIATDAIDAASIKADAVTKIQNGLATPTNITAGTITTVTNLTNLPAITANWLTATGIQDGAITNAKVADDVDVNVKTITADAITATAIQNGAITNAKVADDVDVNVKTITAGAITAAAIATDAIDADAIATDALTEIANAAGFTLKKNTQVVFPFVMTDSTNHAPATGKTVTTTVSKDGGAFGASTNSAAEISDGAYKITLTATEMNATSVQVKFAATGCDDQIVTIFTQG